MQNFSNKTIGIAFTGSFCTYERMFHTLSHLKETGANLYPIFSFQASNLDTKFGTSEEFIQKATTLCGHPPMQTIPEVEPIGPSGLLDLLVISPCTGNTLAKLANGITDTPVLMATKSHLRNNRPVVIALSTNDALGMNLKNIGILLNTKNIYFVPFGQDDYKAKPNSLVAHFHLLCDTISFALNKEQIQPLIQPFLS